MSDDFETGETTAARADFLVERRGFELMAIAAKETACRGFGERDDFIQETGRRRGAVRKR